MATRITVPKDLFSAFVLDGDALTKLDLKLTSIGDRKYVIDCSDRSAHHCSTLDDVLAYDNLPPSTIRTLTVTAGSEGQEYIEIRFSLDESVAPVKYLVQAERTRVPYWQQELERFVILVRQWYTKVALVKFWPLFAGMLVGGVITTVALFRLFPLQESAPTVQLGLRSYSLTSLPLAALLVALRRWLFPVGEFAIGGGLRRHRTRASARNLIGVGFILAVITGVISNWLPFPIAR